MWIKVDFKLVIRCSQFEKNVGQLFMNCMCKLIAKLSMQMPI